MALNCLLGIWNRFCSVHLPLEIQFTSNQNSLVSIHLCSCKDIYCTSFWDMVCIAKIIAINKVSLRKLDSSFVPPEESPNMEWPVALKAKRSPTSPQSYPSPCISTILSTSCIYLFMLYLMYTKWIHVVYLVTVKSKPCISVFVIFLSFFFHILKTTAVWTFHEQWTNRKWSKMTCFIKS